MSHSDAIYRGWKHQRTQKKGPVPLWDCSPMPPNPCNAYPRLAELAAEVWQDGALNLLKLLLAKANLRSAVKGDLSPPWYQMPLRKTKPMQFSVSRSPDFSSTY